MKKKRNLQNLIVLITLILSPFEVHAQKQNAFPYELSLKKDLILSAGGLLISGTPLLFQDQKPRLTEEDLIGLSAEDINVFDRFAVKYTNSRLNIIREDYELVINTLSVGSIAGFSALAAKDKPYFSKLVILSTIYLEGLMISHGSMFMAKTFIHRNRPYVYNTDLSINARTNSSANKSFFSGNATTVFYNGTFIAKTFSDIFPDSKYKSLIWAGTMGLAVTSGVFSVFSGMHFPTDVLTGAAIGVLCGYFIPEMHKKEQKISIYPVSFENSTAIGLTYRF